MEISFIILIFLIGYAGSFISGMVGIGGSIIKYPMLLYIPVVFGFTAFTSHEVAGISAVQVFFATIGGVLAYKGSGYLNKRLIVYMGSAILIGRLLGASGSGFLAAPEVDCVYAVPAVVAAVMMKIGRAWWRDWR